MRRLSILLAVVGMGLVMVTGVAIADTIDCIANRICVGTDGPDTLTGTSRSDYLEALQSNDKLYGREGYDVLDGDNFEARDTSTDGNDRIGGGQNYDELYGYGGNDKLLGRSGGDFIFAEESENEGEDVVRATRETTTSWQETGSKTPSDAARESTTRSSSTRVSTRSATAANIRGEESIARRRRPPARPRK